MKRQNLSSGHAFSLRLNEEKFFQQLAASSSKLKAIRREYRIFAFQGLAPENVSSYDIPAPAQISGSKSAARKRTKLL
jgi:hypothetical protein